MASILCCKCDKLRFLTYRNVMLFISIIQEIINDSRFRPSEPKCTETDLENSFICQFWGQSVHRGAQTIQSVTGMSNLEPKCTETDLKKSKICPIWDQSNPIWSQP